MKESDWKVFKKIKDKAIDRFCKLALDESQNVISDKSEGLHEQYSKLYQLLKNKDKKMALLFDGHSRSNAWLQLLAIRSEGIADEDLLTKLSDEFREQTDPKILRQ